LVASISVLHWHDGHGLALRALIGDDPMYTSTFVANLTRSLLTSLGLPAEPATFAPARAPPQAELAWHFDGPVIVLVDPALPPPGPDGHKDDRLERWRDGVARHPWVEECVNIVGDMAK
jgi:hypothetical protein